MISLTDLLLEAKLPQSEQDMDLYARKYKKTIDIEEPFSSLQTQGMVCHQTYSTEDKKWLFPNEVIKENNKFYNRFVWINADGSIHHYDKRHRYTPAGEHVAYQAGATDGIIDFKGWKVCLRICYDLRFPVWSRNTSAYDLLVFVVAIGLFCCFISLLC